MTGLDASIANLERRRKDLENYSYIINTCRRTNISSDEAFQRKFTYFYRVRRNSTWRQAYYGLFEENKESENITFESILRAIFERTGKIEASFASKMLATLKPEMPIWDSIVLSKLGIKPSQSQDKKTRLLKTVGIYDSIVAWYEAFYQGPDAQRFVEAFDRAFPEFNGFSKMKKIDFLIWGSGDADLFIR